MPRRSKNSRVGRVTLDQVSDCLPKYNPANVGYTWRTKNLGTCQKKWNSKTSSDGIKHKRRI